MSKFNLIFIFLIVYVDDLNAQKLKPDEVVKIEEENPRRDLSKAFIATNIAVSDWFDSAADGLDLFLIGKRVTSVKNKTRFRVDNNTYSVEGKDLRNFTGVGVLLNLPNVEKYWQLKFTSYDEQEENRDVRRNFLKQTRREQNYGATVGVFRKLGKIRTAFEPRIELTDPLKISHSLQFESVADMKKYKINPKLEFFASASRGLGTYQRVNFNFELSRQWSLTLINEGEYQEKIRFYNVTHGLSFGHYLSDKQTLSYTMLTISNNRPTYHFDALNFSIAWSEILYKNMLSYQIVPNYDISRGNRFRGRAGATVTFTLNF